MRSSEPACPDPRPTRRNPPVLGRTPSRARTPRCPWLARALRGSLLVVAACAGQVWPWPALGGNDAAPRPEAGVLTADAERLLKPGDRFVECAGCPELVVIPAGAFLLGSAHGEGDADE